MSQKAIIEELQSQLIQVKAMIFGGERFAYENGQVIDKGIEHRGFSLDSNGLLKASGAEISGHIEADSGFFHGELEAGPLKANTQPVTGQLITYNANTSVRSIIQAELNRFGIQISASPASLARAVSGTYGGQSINRIILYDQGRAGVGDLSFIRFHFLNGQQSQDIMSMSNLPSALSFRYSTEGWNVILSQLPINDPKIPGVVWRDGSNLRVSIG
jgi:hypothetical protein